MKLASKKNLKATKELRVYRKAMERFQVYGGLLHSLVRGQGRTTSVCEKGWQPLKARWDARMAVSLSDLGDVTVKMEESCFHSRIVAVEAIGHGYLGRVGKGVRSLTSHSIRQSVRNSIC